MKSNLSLMLTMTLLMAGLLSTSAFAQTTNQTSQDIAGAQTNQTGIAQSEQGAFQSFSASGSIASMIMTAGPLTTGDEAAPQQQPSEPPYVLGGDWIMDVENGRVEQFIAYITMVHTDGTGRHTHEFAGFQPYDNSTVQLERNGSAIAFGTLEVTVNDTETWSNVPASIIIDNYNIVKIALDQNATGFHFQAQPIYGVVESIRDESGADIVVLVLPQLDRQQNTAGDQQPGQDNTTATTATAMQEPINGSDTGGNNTLLEGVISSIQIDDEDTPAWITAGSWKLESTKPLVSAPAENNATQPRITDFQAELVMVSYANGTGYHTHEISNFEQTGLLYNTAESVTINGTMTVTLDGRAENVSGYINIWNDKMAIFVDPGQLDDHFGPRPIAGIVMKADETEAGQN